MGAYEGAGRPAEIGIGDCVRASAVLLPHPLVNPLVIEELGAFKQHAAAMAVVEQSAIFDGIGGARGHSCTPATPTRAGRASTAAP